MFFVSTSLPLLQWLQLLPIDKRNQHGFKFWRRLCGTTSWKRWLEDWIWYFRVRESVGAVCAWVLFYLPGTCFALFSQCSWSCWDRSHLWALRGMESRALKCARQTQYVSPSYDFHKVWSAFVSCCWTWRRTCEATALFSRKVQPWALPNKSKLGIFLSLLLPPPHISVASEWVPS